MKESTQCENVDFVFEYGICIILLLGAALLATFEEKFFQEWQDLLAAHAADSSTEHPGIFPTTDALVADLSD